MRKTFPKILFVYIILSLIFSACSMPNIVSPAQPEAAQESVATPTAIPDQNLPPKLVETLPIEGSSIGLQEPLTFYFNQPMERASVEAAWNPSPAVVGEFAWVDDATLTFTPSTPLEAGASLNVRFETGAKSAKGVALPESVQSLFNAADAIHPVQFLPENGSSDLSVDSAVVVTFDQPIVPLGADAATLPIAFTLEPAAQGRGEWINTSTYVFYSEPALVGGQAYKAVLNPDLRSVAGTVLADVGSWSFSTALPRLLKIDPSTEIPLPLDLEMTLTFNQPMDAASVESNFSLLGDEGGLSGTYEWAEDFRSVTFIADNLLARNSSYRFALSEFTLAQGGTAIENGWDVEMISSPDFAVLSTDPEDGGVTNEYFSGHVYFTADVARDNIDDFLTISPEVPSFSAGVYDNSINFGGGFDFETRYTVTVSSALKDRWGQELGDDFSYSFSTPAPEPKISLPYIGSPFYFSSANEPTFYIQSTNISRVDLTLGEVALADFFRLFGSDGYDERQSYQAENEASWRQDLDIEKNKSQSFALDLTPNADALTPGIYSLRVWEGGAEGGSSPSYFIASNVNTLFKFGTTDALVWATDLETNAPVAGQTVSVYDETGTLIATGTTDAQGIWYGEIPPQEDFYQNYYVVLGQIGEENFGFGSSVWGEDISPWRFGLSMDRRPPHTEVYLYTDRPIYRPGQTVYFRAIVREAFDGRYGAAALTSLPLTVSNSWGDNIHTLNPALSEYGAAQGSFVIPKDSPSGYFSFFNKDLQFSANFEVADYRKPEINLSMEMTPSEIKNGASLNAEISAQYYFDAPVSDLPVRWTIYEDNGYFYLPGYRVGNLDLSWLRYGEDYGYYGDFLAEGEGKTNAEGILALDLNDLDISDGTRELTLEITAQDESNQQISTRSTALVHPEDFYIGLRSDTWVGREETEMGFDILTVDWDSAPLSAQGLHADFQQVTWERQEPVNSYESPTFTPVYTPVSDVDFATGNDGGARLSFTPPSPGTYVLEVSGENASTQIMLWVRGAEKAIWPRLPHNHIQLTADKDTYNPGDTAEIFIPNPLDAPTQALVTVERGTIHKSEIINIDAGGLTYSLPLTEADAPNVYLSVTLLGRRDFRVGYAEIEVSAAAQILDVTLTSEPTRSEPGGQVDFGIQVKDSAGNPVQGEFSLAVVDLAVLALADPNSKPIEEAFYEKAHLGVRTTLSMAGDSIYGVFLDGGAGGMGGGGGEGIAVVRENFPDTAYWNGNIITDANGQAQVSVLLPDNLTTWYVDLRGITKESLVGSAEMEIVSTKDVLLRPVTPRFLVVGDHLEMAAIVHNNTNIEQRGKVSLQAIGFLLDDPNAIEQEIVIPAEGRVKVSWWGTAQDAEAAELLFNANFGENKDITRPNWGALPILRYTAPQSFVTAGTLDTARTLTESISLPRSFIPNGGKLEVTLDPSLAAAILQSLEAIPVSKSTSSNEAILSYLLPNIAAYKALQAAGLSEPELEARLEETLEIGVAQLLANQNNNFGWDLYAKNEHLISGSGVYGKPSIGGGGIESDPYISAYILFGLWQGRDAGVYIDESVFSNARDYLHSASLPYLSDADPATWQKDRLAFIQYVLQMTGGADAIAVDQLDLWRETLSPWAQALLALTFESRQVGDERASSLFANLESSARRSASGAHWKSDAHSWRNPGTPNYTTATVIYALAQRDSANPLLNDAVRYLAAHRNIHGYWSSTYENAWSLLALTEVAKNAQEFNASYAFSSHLNGSMISEGQANALVPVTTTTLLDSLQLSLPNALNISRGEGIGRLYYRAALFVDRAADTAPALNRGMEVSRSYYDADCEEDCVLLTAAQLSAGAKVKVQVSVNLSNDSYYVQVEDFIPAGAEILNQQLNTSQLGEDADSVDVYDPDKPFSNGWGWWFFSAPQIGDENITWSADYLPAGTYVLSYTIIPLQAGEYRVLPAHAWQSFFPDVQGASAGEVFVVRE